MKTRLGACRNDTLIQIKFVTVWIIARVHPPFDLSQVPPGRICHSEEAADGENVVKVLDRGLRPNVHGAFRRGNRWSTGGFLKRRSTSSNRSVAIASSPISNVMQQPTQPQSGTAT